MSLKTFNAIVTLLKAHNVVFKIQKHAPVVTSLQAAEVRGRGIDEGLKRGAKALILRSEGKFFQFVLPGNKKLSMKKARNILKTKSLSLATHDEVIDLTDCPPGSVPPFGVLWNVPVYASELAEEIDFNAGLHDTTITISKKDYDAIVKPIYVDFLES